MAIRASSIVVTVLVALAVFERRADGLSCAARWCSYEYKYQKKSCKWTFHWGIPSVSCSWTDTDYVWCVHKWGSEPSSSYGEIEFWDDDRIKRNGNGKSTSGTNAQCGKRSDIGNGNCKQDSVQLDGSEAWQC